MWIENERIFGEGFEWEINMVVWSCNSLFYQIISEMHLRKYLTWKGDNKFQNPAHNVGDASLKSWPAFCNLYHPCMSDISTLLGKGEDSHTLV